MKIEQIRAKSNNELTKELEEAHREVFNLRFRLATNQLTNYREISKAKKKIARLKTVLRERELGIR